MGLRSKVARVEAGPDQAEELAAYRSAVIILADVLQKVSDGDLEPRVPVLPGPAELTTVRHRVNHALDVMDAFVREAGVVLASAGQRRFHRRFLTDGMPGAFRDGAVRIDTARAAMRATARSMAEQEAERQHLVEQVVAVSTQVAAASTELGASAAELSESARTGVDEADRALETVHELERTSTEIQRAVTLIGQVASRTRLLALNATIEAARAGEAGRGFGVVATEVKTLADESARSSEDISDQIEAAQSAAEAATAAIGRITTVVRQMSEQVEGVAAAAGGGEGGLSRMAETLHAEIGRFSPTAG